jgi:hypothetical protein
MLFLIVGLKIANLVKKDSFPAIFYAETGLASRSETIINGADSLFFNKFTKIFIDEKTRLDTPALRAGKQC